MYPIGHQGAAMLFYAPLAFIVAGVGGLVPLLLGFGVAFVLASVPDQDQRVPFISHRGITHTVWFALLVAILCGIGGAVVGLQGGIESTVAFGVLGFLVGGLTIVSHIAADAITPMGVKPLEPVSSTKVVKPLAKAKNPIANYALAGIGYGAAIAAALGGLWVGRLIGTV